MDFIFGLIGKMLKTDFLNESWRYRIWRWLGKLRSGATFWNSVTVGRNCFWLSGVHGKTDAQINIKRFTNKPFETALTLLGKNTALSVLDIGANVGQSLLLAKSYADFPVICYEPSPFCAKILKKTVKKNSFRKVKIKNMALGSKTGVLRLYGYSDSDPNASVVPGFRKNTNQSVMVQVTSLDKENKKEAFTPGLIKIDVEGGELEVLLGSRKTLEKYRPIVCVETLYTKSLPHRKRQLRMVRLFKKSRYQIFHFQEGEGLRRCQIMLGDPEYHNNDYICFPREKTRAFLAQIKAKKSD